MTFERAVDFVLGEEGAYSNDPDDPGGETRFGISRRAYPDLDIAHLTREQAIAIYRKDYWDHCRCGELHAGLALAVFDSAVNQGTRRAILMLQQALKISTDGIVGDITLMAANKADSIDTIVEFTARRIYSYATNGNVVRYGLGWFRRVMRSAELALKEVSLGI